MGLCNQLNCCNQQKDVKANEPSAHGDDGVTRAAVGDGSKMSPLQERQQSMNGHLESGETRKQTDEPPVYAAVQKRQSKLPAAATSPIKAEFLVSFVVDCRGGAMTGCRGSGLRILIPAGAVDQPVRVTCRFVRPHSHGAQFPFFPPPLMERDSLASGVIEVGPSGASFKLPVLVEIPYFASLRGGQRELVVLRSDDGETWREHDDEAVFLGSAGWGTGEEGQLYQDVVNSVDLKRAAEDLETQRIVRLSATSFPRYFVLLSRVRTEVRTISPEGGFVEAWLPREDSKHEGEAVRVSFPADALKKKIKIGLQLQRIPEAALEMICNDSGVILEVFPLVGIYPRRRKFHRPIEVSVPLSLSSTSSSRVGTHDVSSHIRLLCSLSSSSEKTVTWEDVSTSAGVSLIDGRLVFQTRVSALFWLVTCSGGGKGASGEESSGSGTGLINLASALYRELAISPYVARLTVLHRRQFPFAWCDALRIYLGVGDRMDGHPHHLLQKQLKDWRKVLDGVEVEVGERSAYYFDMKEGGEFVIAADCQSEAKLDDRLVFRAFRENSMTLLVRTRAQGQRSGAGGCCLVMKRQTGLGGPASKRYMQRHSEFVLDLCEDENRRHDHKTVTKSEKVDNGVDDSAGVYEVVQVKTKNVEQEEVN